MAWAWCHATAQAEEPAASATVPPAVYQQLKTAETALAAKQYAQAAQHLQSILQSGALSGGYAEALTRHSLASALALQNQFDAAAKQLEQAIALQALPEEQQRQAWFDLGQIHLAGNAASRAVAAFERWLSQPVTPDGEARLAIAQAYIQTKQYAKALPHLRAAIQSKPKPPEAWLQLQLALHYEMQDYGAASELLRKLINRYPDHREYWQQLAGVYQQQKQYQKAASLQHLMYRAGWLTQAKDLQSLINLLLFIDAPYRAASILQTEIEAGRLPRNTSSFEQLANAWLQAREYDKAATALHQAAQISPQGELYWRLAQIYAERLRWRDAIAALHHALAKGDLKDPGQAQLLLGTSHYQQKQWAEARAAFIQAAHHKTSRASAEQWLQYLRETAPDAEK